ncbi:DUF2026 family protein [Thalassobius sp. S69A]|uniref:DUF2026 family protein n=1 Tax=unclassified Thalassovita TaxID=2619711 RepID=UPI003C7B124A
MTHRSLITQNEFNLITTAIQGLLETTGHTKTVVGGCAIFACFGAAVMNSKLNIPCRPVAGAWQLHHPNGQCVLGIGQEEERRIHANENGFHMWVQTETHIIDFMSPLYPEVFPEVHSEAPIPRRVLQVPRKDDAKDMGEFLNGSPLFTLPSLDLTKSFVEGVAKSSSSQDLLNVFLSWWSGLEKEPHLGIELEKSTGEYLEIWPSDCKAEGVWKGPGVIAHGV